MVGGGQLGRMFAMAAASMGYRVFVLCDTADDPAAQVATRAVVGDLNDVAAIDTFAKDCDVITLEFENIPAATIQRCSSFAPTYPAAELLATVQDRLLEKRALQAAGLPVTPFREVASADDLIATGSDFGWPIIVKTVRSGYDGKGQHRIESANQANRVPWASVDGWIAEKCIPFDREISVIVARSARGECATFPLFENDHTNHILDVTIVPAEASEQLSDAARKIATTAAEALGLVGILCVEMFVSGDDVMVNEVAPRPHNSGHITIEACHTSQYQQHVRAVCNLPLGETGLKVGGGAMINLLGDEWGDAGQAPGWAAALQTPGVNLHLYGKTEAKRARKMGHLSATADTPAEAVRRARAAKTAL